MSHHIRLDCFHKMSIHVDGLDRPFKAQSLAPAKRRRLISKVVMMKRTRVSFDCCF